MKKVILKIVVLAIVFGLFNMIGLYISPLFENSLAMNQMSVSTESNLLLQVYDYISNYSWLGYIVLTVLVFRKEISEINNKIKSEKEKQNEQI